MKSIINSCPLGHSVVKIVKGKIRWQFRLSANEYYCSEREFIVAKCAWIQTQNTAPGTNMWRYQSCANRIWPQTAMWVTRRWRSRGTLLRQECSAPYTVPTSCSSPPSTDLTVLLYQFSSTSRIIFMMKSFCTHFHYICKRICFIFLLLHKHLLGNLEFQRWFGFSSIQVRGLTAFDLLQYAKRFYSIGKAVWMERLLSSVWHWESELSICCATSF